LWPIGVAAGTVQYGNANSHNIMLNIRWFLQAPPPPPPSPAVRTFIVFFDFDKSNLTAEALQVVQQAVQTARTSGMVRIVVTGHTDTVGSMAYNQRLSERRADAVKTEMVREGLNAGDVSTVGRNFSEPLVPTAPGVREPQNRRAVIDLGR
jgi:OmpA-OmpF porin, OOP family